MGQIQKQASRDLETWVEETAPNTAALGTSIEDELPHLPCKPIEKVIFLKTPNVRESGAVPAMLQDKAQEHGRKEIEGRYWAVKSSHSPIIAPSKKTAC